MSYIPKNNGSQFRNESSAVVARDHDEGGAGSLKTQEREWLDTQAASSYLGMSEGSLRNMTSNGLIPYYKLGRRNRYRVTDLRELLLAQKRGGSYVD
jgi:excisionase family DNA binding protein